MACEKKEVVKVDVDVDEEEDNTIRCINCKKELEGKPWITVGCGKDPAVHACGYSCGQRLKYYVGVGYWHRVRFVIHDVCQGGSPACVYL